MQFNTVKSAPDLAVLTVKESDGCYSHRDTLGIIPAARDRRKVLVESGPRCGDLVLKVACSAGISLPPSNAVWIDDFGYDTMLDWIAL